MANADGRYTLVYNGEIYNFKMLRVELEALGRTFRTRGDTEVLLNDRKSNDTSAVIFLSGGRGSSTMGEKLRSTAR